MNLVLDASMALAWAFPREKKEDNLCADKALELTSEANVLVPHLWHTEIINALLMAERRKIMTEAQLIDYLNRLSNLPIFTDDLAPTRRDIILSLAREHKLTAYDATYLDLSLRNSSILATFDVQLSTAMKRAGGKVLTGNFRLS